MPTLTWVNSYSASSGIYRTMQIKGALWPHTMQHIKWKPCVPHVLYVELCLPVGLMPNEFSQLDAVIRQSRRLKKGEYLFRAVSRLPLCLPSVRASLRQQSPAKMDEISNRLFYVGRADRYGWDLFPYSQLWCCGFGRQRGMRASVYSYWGTRSGYSQPPLPLFPLDEPRNCPRSGRYAAFGQYARWRAIGGILAQPVSASLFT